MRKLESLITEFVGDLLRTIGEANVDDLRELFAGAPQGEAVLKVSAEPLSSFALADMASRPAAAPRMPQIDARRHAASPRRAFLPLSALPPITSPPGMAEITDPESLLSLGSLGETSATNGLGSPRSSDVSSENAAPTIAEPRRTHSRTRAQTLLEVSGNATPAPVAAEHDVESPASGVRAVGTGPTIKLSDNETLARVSNAGVVIRRKKRA